MRIGPQRPVNPDAIVAPQGYRVEALITGLSFPSAISFGPGGEIYLAEGGGVAGSLVAMPRVLRVDPDRSVTEIGRLDNPIVGLIYRSGELLIGEDGPAPRILRVTAEGELKTLVEGLPGGGDYGLGGLALDHTGALVFGLGTRTNSGVVGLDNVARGWVSAQPQWADVPGADVELAGVNYVTAESGAGGTSRVTTGAFSPYGRRCEPGDVVRGVHTCGGAVYRIAVEGGDPERIAWGLRYPVGVRCAPDGRLYAAEGGMEERGSRPIAAASDNLWEILPGAWFGWPDFAGGVPVTDQRFRLPGHPQPRRLLGRSPAAPGLPRATFAPRSGIGRFDFSTSEAFGFVGEALVALSGAWSVPAFPGEAAEAGGHRVVRVNVMTGQTVDFLVNRHGAPSSSGSPGGLERPFEARFDPTGEVLYVVDAGEVQLSRERGLEPFGGTGIIWRITRARPMLLAPSLDDEPVSDSTADESEMTEAGNELQGDAPEAEDEAEFEREETGEMLEPPSGDAEPPDAGSELSTRELETSDSGGDGEVRALDVEAHPDRAEPGFEEDTAELPDVDQGAPPGEDPTFEPAGPSADEPALDLETDETPRGDTGEPQTDEPRTEQEP